MKGDWRSGQLLGAGYAFILGKKVLLADTDRIHLEAVVTSVLKKEGMPDSFVVADNIRQICFILPPWEKPV